jgi:predicted permease
VLVKNPALTLVAVITLALGIGANTAIFSAVNGMLLRPLPVANADRLMVVAGQLKGNTDLSGISYLDYRDLRAQLHGFSDLFAYSLNLMGLEADNKADSIVVNYVTSNYFSALGLKPALGQLIYGDQAEEQGREPVIVLCHSYWKKRFNSDPGIVGRQVKLNGRTATVVGIAPEGFRGLSSIIDTQAFMPMGMSTLWSDNDDFWKKRESRVLNVLGVLGPGVSRKDAQSAIDVVSQRLAQTYPEDKDFSARLYPEWLARPEPDPTYQLVIVGAAFMALAGLVLLLACTNVANIVLVRAAARTREMAVRAALGAARTRLVRQLLTESIILGLLGGMTGLLLGGWVSTILSSIHIPAPGGQLFFDFSLDWRVFAFGMAAALLTGILVGLAPAWRASRTNLNDVLHEGTRGVLAGTARSWLRPALVVAQVAVSLTLLVAAGLFVRSARNAERVYLGFDPSHLLNTTMDVRNIGLKKDQARLFFRDLEDRARALPGVQSVSVAVTVPMGYVHQTRPVYLEGQSADSKEAVPNLFCNSVSLDYFATLRTPLVRGRNFNAQDTEQAPPVAIINEYMAQRYWPKEDAIGKRFSMKGPSGPFIQIVGIAKQGKYNGLGEDPIAFFYLPQEQNPQLVRTLQLRTAGAPELMIPEVDRLIHSMAPGLPLVGVETMEQSMEGVNGMFAFRMGTAFAGALGLLGLVLAIVGVYGVISYTAAQRTHEIGVRMAMGADRRDILKMVLRQGVILVGIGMVVGLALTLVLARGIAGLLVGVSPSDPLTFAGMTVFLAAVGLLASYVPARRAMNLEPLKALKYE